jgi:serine/threonine-protein kinase
MPADTPGKHHSAPRQTLRLRRSTSQIGRRVWSAGTWLILLVALGATFGTFFLASMRIATKAREVEVPSLRGLSVEEATAALTQVGLTIRIDPLARPDTEVPADHVLSQDPEPGSTLRRERAIRVRLSEGQRDPALPVTLGQAERAAEIALLESGIEIAARSEIRSADYGTGSVVAQDPPGGTRSSAVSLLVNQGEAGLSFVMPDVIGTLGSQAVNALRAHGFRVAITAEVPYPGLPRGIVVRQTPQAGFQITLDGSPIALEVSR